jgi:hypothetical protein
MLDFTLLGFISAKTLFLILHVFGVALGAGGAFMTDGMFFLTIKDRVISSTEFKFLEMAHKLVSAGLFLLLISGILLFLQNPQGYLESSKFLAKMTIIAFLSINALVFHFKHIPLFKKLIGTRLIESQEFISNSSSIYISGAISMVSWSMALILGMLKLVPYSYWTIMAVYSGIVIIAILAAMFIKQKVIKKLNKND